MNTTLFVIILTRRIGRLVGPSIGLSVGPSTIHLFMSREGDNITVGKKSGRATFSTLTPRQGVTFMLVSHVSLLLDSPFLTSTFICIPEHF